MSYEGTYSGTIHTYCAEFNYTDPIKFTINEDGFIDLPSMQSLNDGIIDSSGRISGISIRVNSLSLGNVTIPYSGTDDGITFRASGKSSNGIISDIVASRISSDGNDVMVGTDQNDVLEAFNGNDTLKGGSGNDRLYGGNGVDAAVFSGARSEYRIDGDEKTVYVTDLVSSRDGSDVGYSLERLQFADKTIVTKFADDDITPQSVAAKVPNGLNAAYRFYDTLTGDHFYSTSAPEKLQILQTMPHFNYEGAAWLTPNKGLGTQDVFRFLDSKTDTHFYTTNVAERDHLIASMPAYHYEGVAFQAYSSESAAGSGGVTLERFYNTETGQHHFAASAGEAYGINHGSAGPGWVDEGKGFVVHVPTDGMLNV